jgi:hypothetical protein
MFGNNNRENGDRDDYYGPHGMGSLRANLNYLRPNNPNS